MVKDHNNYKNHLCMLDRERCSRHENGTLN